MASGYGGWHDPRVRNLRSLAVVVLLGLSAVAVLTHDPVALGTCTGSLVVILGFGDLFGPRR